AARRSPWLLEGGDTDIWRAGGPNAAQPELLTVSNPYIRPESGDGKHGFWGIPIRHGRAGTVAAKAARPVKFR
ncbi:MAG TPA: hypothetical protein VHL13_12825, partial [Pseudolabrys sp.]|nr:hypothetical protein [Pseudolabrys sp.]